MTFKQPENKLPEAPMVDAIPSSEQELRYLYENAACGYCTLAEDNTISRINATALFWLGFEQHDPDRPTHLYEILEPASHIGFARLANQLRASSQDQAGQAAAAIAYDIPVSFHTRLRQRDGRLVPALLHVSSVAGALHLAIFNFAQTQRLSESLAEARIEIAAARQTADRHRVRMAELAEAAPDGIVSVGSDQRVLYANPAAIAMFGGGEADLTGSHIERFIPARYRARHSKNIEQFGRSGVTVRTMAGRAVTGLRANGTEFPLEAAISQVIDDDEHIYTVFLRDISSRAAVEGALNHARERLKNLSARLRTVREEEQRRVARELHDDIGQRVSALKMEVAALRKSIPDGLPKTFDALDRIDESLTGTVAAVRRLATGLRPKVLDDLGLAPALESFLQDSCMRAGVNFELSVDEHLAINDTLSTEVFRLVQEAVHNTFKHAHAGHIRVSLAPTPGGLALSVRDDGRGMSAYDEDKDGALGLIGMRERVDSVGGRMTIHSAPGQGTLIECVLPAG